MENDCFICCSSEVQVVEAKGVAQFDDTGIRVIIFIIQHCPTDAVCIIVLTQVHYPFQALACNLGDPGCLRVGNDLIKCLLRLKKMR